MLVFCRAHYSIDIFGGYIFGHYFWMLAEKWAWVIDYSMLKIPFHKRFPLFKRKCSSCKEPINQWATFMQGELDKEKRRVVEQDEILGPIKSNNQSKSKVHNEVEEESRFIIKNKDNNRVNTISTQGKETNGLDNKNREYTE